MLRSLHMLVVAVVTTLAIASSAAALTAKTALRAEREFSLHRVTDFGEQAREAHQQTALGYGGEASDSSLAARGAATLEASAVRFSQSSVNGVEAVANSMKASGWVGAPIDVVSVEGRLITVDNTRLLAAHLTDTPVQAMIHGAGEALPASMAGRFGAATTWGEAVMTRIAGQNAAYRAANPLGSWFVGATP